MARFAMTGRARYAARAALLGFALVGGTFASAGSAAPATAARRAAVSSFGATIARWRAAYPLDTSGCGATNCFGPVMPNSSARYEFSYVTTAKGRVDGYDQALRRGTSLLQAQLEVAVLFPADVEMNSFYVKHRDAYGSSCAFYDLSSKTVAQIFGKSAFGGTDGNVGVELATMLPNGSTTYNPDNIDLALVVPSYLSSQDNC